MWRCQEHPRGPERTRGRLGLARGDGGGAPGRAQALRGGVEMGVFDWVLLVATQRKAWHLHQALWVPTWGRVCTWRVCGVQS